ncbi:hypothetical protein [Agreia pratensis]|uniref:Sensor n=1 Tax=Agreia pratensis TaxID=150121 RepID=A0A1X7IV45_9MICO|nr:hypothetical protein [Agreia pratensis]SMG18981.1 hypothetical protein SAMN06296010_0913 [Agreia pratensis]
MSDKSFDGPPLSNTAKPSDGQGVSARSRVLRPFGYAGITIVWLALSTVVAGLVAVIPFSILQQGDLASSPGVENLSKDTEWLAALIALPIVALMFGAVICLLFVGSFSLFVLSLIAFTRSLRPSYAHEQLTTTRWTSDAIGPVRLGGVLAQTGAAPARYKDVLDKQSLSLIPVRRTRFSAFWTSVMFFAWVPSGSTILGGFWLGLAYLVTVAWATWPVTGPMVIVWAAVSLALTAVGLRIVLRGHRANLARQFSQPTT